MQMLSHALKVVAVALALGLALYGAIYFMARDEDSVRFATLAVRHSKAIEGYVGGISSIRLSPGGPYDETEAEGQKRARVALEIEGKKRSATVIVEATLFDGTWKVERATLDGQQISLQ